MAKKSTYFPSDQIIQNYADVLVNFALNSGKGVEPGEVVNCLVPDVAKPLAKALQISVLKAKAHPIIQLLPTGFDKDFYSLANPEQLTFFPADYLKAKSELIDHSVAIIADVDPQELSEVDPAHIMAARNSRKQYRDWLNEKETQGDFTWTIALWGVEAKAKVVGLTLEEYWQQIINACFLDSENPIYEWKQLNGLQKNIQDNLNKLEIDDIHMEGDDVDLHLKLGANRIWMGGSGRNIPSFELFTSPDWRGTEGWIKFNQPVYRYGSVIDDVKLSFEKGLVTEASAIRGEKLLLEMLKTPDANKLGEFSLTDSRMSRITHPMAETLFDENIGGPFGNTHVAIGMAYKDCYRGNAATVTKEEWRQMGFNDSAEHTDIVSTTDRTVTATLSNGLKKVIYKDGKFTV